MIKIMCLNFEKYQLYNIKKKWMERICSAVFVIKTLPAPANPEWCLLASTVLALLVLSRLSRLIRLDPSSVFTVDIRRIFRKQIWSTFLKTCRSTKLSRKDNNQPCVLPPNNHLKVKLHLFLRHSRRSSSARCITRSSRSYVWLTGRHFVPIVLSSENTKIIL